MSGWKLRMRYMPVLGVVQLIPSCPHGSDGEMFWNVGLSEILRSLEVKPEQVRAHMEEAARPDPKWYEGSIEDLCDESIPLDLKGKTVLDIGGYGGRAAKRALDNGAQWAVCLDNRQYEHYGWKNPNHLQGVDYKIGNFLSWEYPMDVALFFNVIYHCPDPRGALAHLRTITKERMLLSSLVVWDDRPVWYPREPYEVNPEDDTVYWSPSDAGLKKLLKATGWEVREVGKTVERLVLECT